VVVTTDAPWNSIDFYVAQTSVQPARGTAADDQANDVKKGIAAGNATHHYIGYDSDSKQTLP
jgi:hypothetical protein